MPAYGGSEACYVDAVTPGQPTKKHQSRLEVRTLIPGSPYKEKLILVRFRDIPRGGAVERAMLELTTDPQFDTRYALRPMAMDVETSCSVFRDDWDAAKATFLEAAPGKPWAEGELAAGGTFLSKAPPEVVQKERRKLAENRLKVDKLQEQLELLGGE